MYPAVVYLSNISQQPVHIVTVQCRVYRLVSPMVTEPLAVRYAAWKVSGLVQCSAVQCSATQQGQSCHWTLYTA